jgi:hypothetical protein
MRRILLTTHVLLALTVTVGAGWAGCSNESLRGPYAITGSGNIVQPPGTPFTGPFVRAGIAVFDGSGGGEFNSSSSYNGFIFSEPFKGTYSVGHDCTIKAVVDLPAPANLTATFLGVVAGNGEQVDYFLLDPPGTTIAATLIRQPRGKCRTGDLSGTYTLRSAGSLVSPNPFAGPYSQLGTLRAGEDESPFRKDHDSKSRFSVSATTSYAGLLKAETYSGTFEVSSDCLVHFEYTQPSLSGSVTSTFDGVLMNDNKQVDFVLTNATDVVAGTLTRQ